MSTRSPTPASAAALAGQVGLGAADRDADHVNVVVEGGVDRHRSPAAADVEQPGARLLRQAELAADQFVLGGLRGGEVHPLVGEARTRVGHRRAEHDPVEIVADVVVVTDRRGVAPERVHPAAEASLFRGRRQRPPEQTEATGRLDATRQRRPAGPHALAGDTEHGVEHFEQVTFGVEVAGDVCPGQPQLVRAPQHSPQRIG